MGRHDWETRTGSRVWIETDRRGEFIRCDGCRRRMLITGMGPSQFAARQHADTCRKQGVARTRVTFSDIGHAQQ